MRTSGRDRDRVFCTVPLLGAIAMGTFMTGGPVELLAAVDRYLVYAASAVVYWAKGLL
jgi:hypothetical protein